MKVGKALVFGVYKFTSVNGLMKGYTRTNLAVVCSMNLYLSTLVVYNYYYAES